MARLSKDKAKAKALVIYRHLVRGFQPGEIAQAEGLRLRLVHYYIQEGGRILDGEFAHLTKASILREMWSNHQERKLQLWTLYAKTANGMGKVACLKLLADEDERLEHIGLRMGILDPLTTLKGQLDVNVNEKKDIRIRIDEHVHYDDTELATRFPDLLSRIR